MNKVDPVQLSDHGPLLVFAHANGYPPEAYRTFLEPFLSKYQVWQIYFRPFWPGSDPQAMRDWRVFRDDLIPAVLKLIQDSRADETAIGVGHSLGGASLLMSAIQHPGLFSKLVLMDPVIFPRWQGTVMRLFSPFKLLKRIHPLIRGTLKRRTWFESREAMFQRYRQKGVFHRFPDQVLRDYVDGLGEDLESGGVGLRWSPEWEARIYETGGLADWVIWRSRARVQPPTLIIRGEETYTLHDPVIQSLVRKMPQGEYATIQGTGHLLPLEDPAGTAAVALKFLDSS